jgi:hypothetical protein
MRTPVEIRHLAFGIALAENRQLRTDNSKYYWHIVKTECIHT